MLVTGGGGDTITLGAHVRDRIEVYGVANGATSQTPGSIQGAAANAIVNTADQATGGFWGQAPGAAPVSIFTLFPGTSAATFGTSADQSLVSGFLVGGTGDSLDFSRQAFGTAAAGHRGLTTVDGASAAATGPATLATVSSGGSLGGTTADVVVIAGSTFANASALAQALKTGTLGLNLSADPTAGFVANMLFAYNDAAGNGHIADVAINEAANSRSFAAQTNVIAQDLVQLTGVSVGSLTSNNIQIVG